MARRRELLGELLRAEERVRRAAARHLVLTVCATVLGCFSLFVAIPSLAFGDGLGALCSVAFAVLCGLAARRFAGRWLGLRRALADPEGLAEVREAELDAGPLGLLFRGPHGGPD